MKLVTITTQGTPLKARRVQCNLSQATVCRATGISASYMAALERGKSIPTLTIARKLAEALGSTLDALWPPDDVPDGAEGSGEAIS